MVKNKNRVIGKVRSSLFGSFAGKLTFFIFLLMIALFSVKSTFDYRYGSKKVLEMENREFVNRLSRSLLVMRDSINNTELALAATLDKVYNNFDDDSHFPQATESLLSLSGNTYGSAIALEHGKHGGNYMIYSSKTDEGEIETLTIHSYDYRNWDWYYDVRQTLKPIWGDPYYDKSLSDRYLCTYSYPLLNSDGEFAGVFTADITLDDYEKLLESLRPYDNDLCYIELIGKNGSYIASPTVPNDTIIDIRSCGNYTQEALGYILSTHDGTQISEVNGKECLIVHTLVDESIGWRLIMVCPMDVIMADMKKVMILTWVSNIIFLLLLLIVIYIVVHNVLKPITTLSELAQKIAKDLNRPVPAMKGVTEIKRLRNSMESMRKSLCGYIDEVRQMTTENERIENELKIAREIQTSMLPDAHPSFENHEEFTLGAYIRPAKEVGGDFYDYILRDHKLFFLIGDASGKGVPASMFMAVTCYLYRTLAMEYDSASEIMGKLNNVLCHNNSTNMFETIIVGILDLCEGALEICNAGHTPPLAICSSQMDYIKLHSNIPVGAIEGFEYVSDRFLATEGDTLLFYTDGVTEAENAEGKQYGKERLKQTVSDKSGRDIDGFLDGIVQSISGFTKGVEQSDDITVLAIRYEECRYSNELSLKNRMEEMEKITAEIEEITEKFSLGKTGSRIMLAVEEAAVNIINYAWPEGTEGCFTFTVKIFQNSLTVILKDSGKMFDPMGMRFPDTNAALEERKIGGLGVMLLRKLSDSVSYHRSCDGKNILTMKFKI